MGGYIIAHDLGTSGDKGILLSVDGKIAAEATVSYEPDVPAVGWMQQNPEVWWNAFCRCNRRLLEGISGKEVEGVTVTGQMMCCLAMGRDGTVLYPAILWGDGRAAEEAMTLEERVGGERFYETVGMRASPNYSLPKMMWLKGHEAKVYERTWKFLNPKDYLDYKMTGRMATDTESAAYMHGTDWRTGKWSKFLITASELDEDKLPEILAPGELIGEVTQGAARECGLPAGTAVVMNMGDGGTATLGTATIEPGEAYISMGSSSWVSVVTGSGAMDRDRSISKLSYLDTVRDSGTMQTGGYAYSWLRDTLCQEECREAKEKGISAYVGINETAGRASCGSGGVLFQPYLMGERSPFWDMKLRGAFLGLTSRTGKPEICRSVLEGVALHLNLILQRICRVNGIEKTELMKLVGGGAKSPLWRTIFADILGAPVAVLEYTEHAGGLGAAVLAGVRLGSFSSVSVIKELQKVTDVTEPDWERHSYYCELGEIYSEAQRALETINHRICDLEMRR